MAKPPKLSVIMGVYNVEKYLARALDGLLAQTFTDFELICVNDASTDGSEAILKEFAAKDPRVQYVSFPENRGVCAALNEAIGRATAPYIAIADSDDLYLPNRFEKQVRFLDHHPDYVVVGSSMMVMNQDEKILKAISMPENDVSLRWHVLFNSPFLNPTVMLRAGAIKKAGCLYNPQFRAAGDYDMWTRVLRLGKGHNFREPFLLYRVHDTAISQSRQAEQVRNRDLIALALLQEKLGDHGLTAEEVDEVRRLFINKIQPAQTASPEAIQNYTKCLKLYITALTEEEARLFVYEQQAFLGKPYLSELGMDTVSFIFLTK